jgi:hypothetical protein
VNPYASSLPLIIILTVTAFKQGYEDILRHREDWKVNSKKVRILQNDKFITKKYEEIKVCI